MQNFGHFLALNWRHAIEIAILWAIIYYTYQYFRATRGARIFTALVGTYIGMTLLSDWLHLSVIGWLLKYISVILAVALIIIFQPELRRALAELGSHRFFSRFNEKTRKRFADQLIDIVKTLSRQRVGALIAIQRSDDLRQYLDAGVEMDCLLTPEIVYTIFYDGTTLHDGGLIVRMIDERISGAGCVFPLNQRELADRSIGLRHRASMGITEESDAIALVVSEETGTISIANEGKLERGLDDSDLRNRLSDLLFSNPYEDEEGEEEAAMEDPSAEKSSELSKREQLLRENL